MATETCFADSGAPALHEPHLDEFGSGADIGCPPGEEGDVAVVAASREPGDGGVFQPTFVDEGGHPELVDQLCRAACHGSFDGPEESGHQRHTDARSIRPPGPGFGREVGESTVTYAAVEDSECLGERTLVGAGQVRVVSPPARSVPMRRSLRCTVAKPSVTNFPSRLRPLSRMS